MAKIISASIDLSKIDKAKIVNGKDGRMYLDITIICNDELDQYGRDTQIVHGQTKEEREQKVQKVYLGNGKTIWSGDSKPRPEGGTLQGASADLPF
jgi:hypothetical protein